MLKPGFFESVRKTGEFFMEGLKKLQRDSNKITDIRGKGLLLGRRHDHRHQETFAARRITACSTTQAGDATYRITPPLIVT
jgi:acetylornithine/succinyldiaminopimelate/putrescine aminotransferase